MTTDTKDIYIFFFKYIGKKGVFANGTGHEEIVKIITQKIFNNCFKSLFGEVDIQEFHGNKKELSSLLTEVELIPLLTSITAV